MILRQDIFEVMGASGDAALANPRLFVSSLLDVDAGRTREAKVLANNCTDQLMGIYSSAGRDAQALNQASSKAKSYLVSDRYLNEDVSSAIADAFEDALCRYYGIESMRERQRKEQLRRQQEEERKRIQEQERQRKEREERERQEQLRRQREEEQRRLQEERDRRAAEQAPAPQPASQPAPAAAPAPQQDSPDSIGTTIAVWAFTILTVVCAVLSEGHYFVEGEYFSFFFLVILAGVVAFFGSASILSNLRDIVKGKGSERVFGLLGVLIPLGIASYTTYEEWARWGKYGVHKEPVVFVTDFLTCLCVGSFGIMLVLAFLGGLGKTKRK